MRGPEWPFPNSSRITAPPPHVRRPKTVPVPRGYYKPASLRWPFLAAQLALLAAVLGVLVALQRLMPDSDHSAVVDGRPLARSVPIVPDAEIHPDLRLRNVPYFKRQINSSDATTDPTTQLLAATTPPPVITPAPTSSKKPTTTSSKKSRSNPFNASNLAGSAHNNNGHGSVRSTPEPTTGFTGTVTSSKASYTDTVKYEEATNTEDVNRQSSEHAQGSRTTITELLPPSTTSAPLAEIEGEGLGANAVGTTTTKTDIAGTAPEPEPPLVTETMLTGGITTTAIITGTVTQAPQTTTDPAGIPIIITPPPVLTTQTVTGIIGASAVSVVRTDDGLTAETSTITAIISSSLVTLLSVYTPGRPITETLVSVVGGTVSTVTPSPTTFVTSLSGGVLTTITSTPAPYIITTGGSTTTMTQTRTPGHIVTTDIITLVHGTPTTIKTVMTITPTPTSQTPLPTGTGKPGSENTRVRVLPGFTPAQYFAVTYLPTFIAAFLAIPFNMINTNAKLMQPLHNLATRTKGGRGSDTLNLDFGGFFGFTTSFSQAFRHGEPLPLLTDVGTWLSSLLAPMAAEAIGFKVHGICTHLNISGCGITPGISLLPMTVLLVLVVALMMLLVGLMLLLRRWETGVHADPWGLAAVASLSLSSSLRARFDGEQLSDADLKRKLERERFRLAIFDVGAESHGAWYDNWGPCYEYGILPVEDTDTPYALWRSTATIAAGAELESRPRHIPFLALTYISRILFTAALLGLMALLAYYHQPLPDNAFELFMDSQGFGVRFLFALIGTAIAIFWRSFFQGVAAIGPFSRMARHSQPATQSILVSPATNSVSGVVTAMKNRDFLLLSASIMAGLAELLLPTLLANIPFALTSTYPGHVGSTAASLSILGLMVAVLGASLIFTRWPHLPVDPRTLAGSIYYVSRSERLQADLRGRRLALHSGKDRDAEVEGLGRRYGYGPEEGQGGERRMAVEVDEDHWHQA